MKVTGTHICENCKNEIEWVYIFPEAWNNPQVEEIPKGKVEMQCAIKISHNEHEVEGICPNCGRDIHFILKIGSGDIEYGRKIH